MHERTSGTGVGDEGWFLASPEVTLRSAAYLLSHGAGSFRIQAVLVPRLLDQHLSTIPSPGSSNNEADKFYNAQHYTKIYNKTRKTNNEVQVIMKKKPAVRDMRV